jgi:23S rRNA (guanosine2251-2'-O)-methyltransferase
MPSKTGKKRIPTKNRSQNRPLTPKRVNAPNLSTKRSGTCVQTRNQLTANNEASHRPNPPKPPRNGYIIWGRHAVFAALRNNERRVAQIYVAHNDGKSELKLYLSTLPLARRNELPPIQWIERKRLDAVAGPYNKAVHQGMAVAVWPVKPPQLDDFLKLYQSAPLRLLLLDRVSDPRNVGAILRSAHAFGVAAVITTSRHAAEENGLLARAASGALDHLYYLRVTNLARAIERLKQDHITVAGLAADGDMTVESMSNVDRLAVVLGAEGSGLRRLCRVHCDHLVRIDINQKSDSLNVSNAAAIALYAVSTLSGR